MPLPALWYGVIVGEIIYLGGEWVDKMRAKRRATMRLEMEQSKKNKEKRERRRQRQRERKLAAVDAQPVVPVYEEPETEDEHGDRSRAPSRRYIMDQTRPSHDARDRGVDYRSRHNDHSNQRSHYFNAASSSSPNMERGLVLSDRSPSNVLEWLSTAQQPINPNNAFTQPDPYANLAANGATNRQRDEFPRHRSRRSRSQRT